MTNPLLLSDTLSEIIKWVQSYENNADSQITIFSLKYTSQYLLSEMKRIGKCMVCFCIQCNDLMGWSEKSTINNMTIMKYFIDLIPLHQSLVIGYASKWSDVKTVKWLINKGYSINLGLCYWAIQNKQLEIQKYIKEMGYNCEDSYEE